MKPASPLNRLLLTLYRMTASPLLIFALPFLSLSTGKIGQGLRLRRRPFVPLNNGERPVWIHAASGEFEYAKAVIREIKTRAPQTPVLVTYFSPTYARNVENFPGVDVACALPLDLPGPCATFLKRYNPKLLLLARTDLWPEMLEQCRLRAIPVRLFAYTQKPLAWPKTLITRWRLSWIEKIYCVSQADQQQVEQIAPGQSVETLGDTRYDQVKFRLEHPKLLPQELKPDASTPCLVAGSTWSEDEAVLLEGLKSSLLENRLKLILVPHEPEPAHIAELKKRLSVLGLTYALYSEGRAWADKQVLLVDQVGVLAELYLWGDLAFVGGSFRKTVHSVMEALGAGCMTFVGPKHLNNRETMEFKNLKLGDHGGISVITSARDLQNQMAGLLTRPSVLTDFKARLLKEFSSRLGASAKLADKIHF